MIEVRDLVKSHGGLKVLDGVSLAVRRGEVAVIVGPSGGGKSTLLRCINGLETFEAGEVRVDTLLRGPGLSSERILRDVRRRVGMVFQQFHLFPHLSVLENVLSGPCHVLGRRRADAEPEAVELLRRVGMENKAKARPEELSGGQQQRVAIARALAVHPEAVLFDEPTSALDPRMANEVLDVIDKLADDGQTMVVVTHAMNFARRVADTLHVMHAGKVIESGPPEQVFASPQREETRWFLGEQRESAPGGSFSAEKGTQPGK
jgi:ABC-type polar amino acid transport system ATPase subunit